jgi:hypothetical protein
MALLARAPIQLINKVTKLVNTVSKLAMPVDRGIAGNFGIPLASAIPGLHTMSTGDA